MVLLLFYIASPLLAEEQSDEDSVVYRIEDITIHVKGMTNGSLLLKRVGVTEEQYEFAAYEELEQFAAGVRQKMVNMRIFDDISYTISPVADNAADMGRTKVFHVAFLVDDAFTTLVIPYGKYDSNYGFKAGFKLYDHNLLGTLSDFAMTSNVKQTDLLWDEPEYFTTLKWKNISFFGSDLNISSEFTINQDNGVFGDGVLTTSGSMHGLSLFGHGISLSTKITTYQLDDGGGWGNSDIALSLALRDIKIPLGRSLALSSTISIDQNGSSFDAFEYTYSLNSTISNLNLFITKVNLTSGVDFAVYPLQATTSRLTSFHTTVSDSFVLPLHIRYSPSVNFVMNMDGKNPYFDFHNALSYSYNKINWKHNFREGLSITLANSLNYDTVYSFNNHGNISNYTSLRATAFTIIFDRINIGSRMTAFYSPLDDYSFMNSSKNPAEYMRGILNKNESLDSAWRGKYGGVLNINVMATLIDLDGITEFIVSPFLDIGLFDGGSLEDLNQVYSGGLELYCIFDKYKSYPFNASIGYNLKDVASYLRGDMDYSDLPFEILMSLDLFY